MRHNKVTVRDMKTSNGDWFDPDEGMEGLWDLLVPSKDGVPETETEGLSQGGP